MDRRSEKEKPKVNLKGPTLGYSDIYPSRKIWEELAEAYGGEFKIRHTSGHVLEIHTLRIPHGKWSLKVSVSDSRPLKFVIAFPVSQEFELSVSWEDFLSRILERLGRHEVKLGAKEFDKRYRIRSNRSDLVKKILTKDIQQSLLKHNVHSIVYHTDRQTRTAEMVSVIQRNPGEKEMLVELIETFKTLIDHFKQSGIIQ